MKNTHAYILYGLVAVLFILVLYYRNSPEATSSGQRTGKPYTSPLTSRDKGGETSPRVKLLDLPEKMEFAGEPVPLGKMDIKERFEREMYVNAFWESNMLLMMKRSAKYLPTIEKILAEYNIPEDFKYVALIESGLQNVVSPAGARGFWQFMEGTAKDFGLEVTREVDERYDFEKATHAACKYLQQSYAKFGKWTSVAASYNIGQTGLRRRMNDQQQPDYYELLLNEETGRYMFRILAFKEIFEHPEKYGFVLDEKDYYHMPTLKTLVIKSSVKDLAEWAIKNGTNYKQLKIYNPWLRTPKLTVRRDREYKIKLPAD
ncbi:lytic transglycosylase domain-containing protein [Echinicola strongylocentroti]|uniref:Lytic transglycosylase domain-containing protein n=1 Tax=Echinicola strongylocentroti TaxID=1795355 RepID=A0A2Z4IJ01_9BACT|nr:lytic transglycosylase domain-containing protein [Echinicola strongylocentroti]AWW30934.1 lytic transglycosylase domain-containing protein [Echinicola strongylocentroti]